MDKDNKNYNDHNINNMYDKDNYRLDELNQPPHRPYLIPSSALSNVDNIQRYLAARQIGFRCGCTSAWLNDTHISTEVSMRSKKQIGNGRFSYQQSMCSKTSFAAKRMQKNADNNYSKNSEPYDLREDEKIIVGLFENLEIGKCFLNKYRNMKCMYALRQLSDKCIQGMSVFLCGSHPLGVNMYTCV